MLSFLKSTCTRTCRVADLRRTWRVLRCAAVCWWMWVWDPLSWFRVWAARLSTGENGVSKRTARPRDGNSVKDRHLANGIQIYGVHELVPVTITRPTIDDG